MASLYIHIPFCVGKCEYCSFNSYPGMEWLFSRYVKALKKEIANHFFSRQTTVLETVFFGGGTPSILSVDQIDDILTCCRDYIGVADDAEVSLEANPRTLDFMKLLQLRQAGFNRLSIGVQSFIDEELESLGRLHTAQDSWDCVRDAIGAGFSNISLDLMYGVPGQTAERWRWNLENAISLETDHLSLYQLTVEDGTPLAVQIGRGDLTLPDEEEVDKMDEITRQLCGENELHQYEISNYARPGFECRHNINYWRNQDYIGIGAGAVGYYRGARERNIENPLHYCEAVEWGSSVVTESEKLSAEESFRESVVMGLRMNEGVSFTHLYDRFRIRLQEYYGEVLTLLQREGLVEFTATHFRLTDKGRYLANQVMARLV